MRQAADGSLGSILLMTHFIHACLLNAFWSSGLGLAVGPSIPLQKPH